MSAYEIKRFNGGISDYEDRGIAGAFKFGANLDIRKDRDTLSCGQALEEEGLLVPGVSPSASISPSASVSPSNSPSQTASPSSSTSPSSSQSHSPSPTTGISDSPSRSPSASASPSASQSPSTSISPSPSPSGGLSTVFQDLIIAFIEASDGYVYEFGNTGYVYRRDADKNHIQVYKDPNGAITGAYEWYSNTKTYLFFVAGDILKKKDLDGRSDWNDVETVGTLEHDDFHTMCEAGGSLIITNKSRVALVGYDQSFTNEAVNLIPGNISKTIVERNGRSIIGTVRASAPNKGINGAIDSEVPLAQVGDDGELFFANMSDTVPAKRFPGGGKVNPYGVANLIKQANFFEWEQNSLSWIDKQGVGNLSLWGVFGGESGKNGIYSYGRKNKNKPFVMNLDHEMDVDEIGAIAVIDGVILASYRDGTEFGVRAVNPDQKARAIYEGLDSPPTVIKNPDKPNNWKYVEVFGKPLPSGSSIEFHYRMDKYGDFIQAKTAEGEDVYDKTNGKKAVFRIGADGQIYEPKIVLNPYGNNSPEVYRIRTYFV